MAKIAKFDLEKISESANIEIDKLKAEYCMTVTICHSSAWVCDYCGNDVLVMCLKKQAEYCPICGNIKSAKGEIVREVIL